MRNVHDWKTMVVVNPQSGGGQTGRQWPTIRNSLREAGVGFDYHVTGRPREATGVVAQALRSGYGRIVAVGGDGTFDEVVNGFFDDGKLIAPDAVMGMIPRGTGGDFRRSVGVPLHVGAACALLARGDTRPIDVGKMTGNNGSVRYFVNIADCGLGADVVARVNRGNKRGGGKARFLISSVRSILTFQASAVDIIGDDVAFHGRAQSVVVANGQYFGGGMHIAPDAIIDDGLFDVIVIGERSRRQTLVGFKDVYSGTHLQQADIQVFRSSTVTISSPDDTPPRLEADGEGAGTVPTVIECLPRVLRFCRRGTLPADL